MLDCPCLDSIDSAYLKIVERERLVTGILSLKNPNGYSARLAILVDGQEITRDMFRRVRLDKDIGEGLAAERMRHSADGQNVNPLPFRLQLLDKLIECWDRKLLKRSMTRTVHGRS
jgi:hypothetical protein